MRYMDMHGYFRAVLLPWSLPIHSLMGRLWDLVSSVIDFMDNTAHTLEAKDEIVKICSNYLTGEWVNATSKELEISPITGGATNRLLLLRLPHHSSSKRKQVLLRIYSANTCTLDEQLIVTLLGERNLAAKVFALFPEGRIEEYIESRSPSHTELLSPDLFPSIARHYAKVHQLHFPIKKEPTGYIELLEGWIETITRLHPPFQTTVDGKPLVMDATLLKSELELIKKCLSHSTSPVVFCHNDINHSNILIPLPESGRTEKLLFIDFEFAGYNYRAFDLADFFQESRSDGDVNAYPYYRIDEEAFPTPLRQEEFCRYYLEAIGQPSDDKHVKDLVDEIQPFLPVTVFGWGLWSLRQMAIECTIPFGFEEHTIDRIRNYFLWKHKLIALLPESSSE